ncbi:unnamed protein product [Didymodactylos carnosus]|uniref:C2H2-type domain-containing protein n=1 Tax=Didymodactylos carnosus TaxID=1234261 RepID=A0A814DYD4_9BILA|nr:unnamed protein product [Didymodactylos carnosus]CAF1305030.1 unnamed protein product [Didymodactylos carnosus]CAF3736597.1 unnamed protein product [Didymodactylos carnosus]CAF4112003.1 unnamed protein product [Didymodactylos carnosus]
MVATLTTKDYSEYIHPSSQTTIDMKQSPLVLMAQACNNIGKELGLADVTSPSFNKYYQSSSTQVSKCDKPRTRSIVHPQQNDKNRTISRKSLSPSETTNNNRAKSSKRSSLSKSLNEYESSPQKQRHTTNRTPTPLPTNIPPCSPPKNKQTSSPFLPSQFPVPLSIPPSDFSPENPFLIPSLNPMHFFDPTLLSHLTKTCYSPDLSSPSIASANSAFTSQRNDPHYYLDQIIREYSNKYIKNTTTNYSPSSSTQQPQFVCNWMESSDGFCGKRFQSQLALLDHLCTHTSGENNHSKTIPSSLRFHPYKPSPNSSSCSSLPYFTSSALNHLLATAPVSSLYTPTPFGLYPPPLGFFPNKL